ncbi:betaine/proline/choline family ABC transporter ATP-binding protein [Gymnodinialimonas sp. 2305UL16-5]|uniref:quaternary amine ABC transporter ATP-binding protein n=1 Tax=Gymnodinialimonas mytili TaxID=3126503 RepID=UPI0030AB70D3
MTATPPVSSATPKLSAKHVWKLYGQGAAAHLEDASRLPQNGGDLHALCQAIRDDNGIVASADVSFDVMPGEIFVIMGLSGSGKSTIVRCLSRLVEPTAGEILLDGEDLLKASPKELIDIRRHKMGMVFQSFGLMPHLNVRDNIAFPLKLQGLSLRDRLERADRVIDLVGLEGREDSFPNQLSGGQQQRVGIARSLAIEPEVWFLDEPFSALDPLIRRQMQDEFLRLQSELHKSIVFITHDFLEALRVADRMAIMKDGAVVQIGRPVDLILNPADDYVREFTNDVPWELVLTAADVATDHRPPEDLPIVDGGTQIVDLLPQLAAADHGVAVKLPAGTMGHLTSRDVITALASGVKTDP